MHAPPLGQRLRAAPWVLLIVVFVISLPAVTIRFYASDEIEYFAYLRSLAFDQDLDFENEYRHFYEQNPKGLQGFHYTFLELRDEATGRRLNFGPLGSDHSRRVSHSRRATAKRPAAWEKPGARVT